MAARTCQLHSCMLWSCRVSACVAHLEKRELLGRVGSCDRGDLDSRDECRGLVSLTNDDCTAKQRTHNDVSAGQTQLTAPMVPALYCIALHRTCGGRVMSFGGSCSERVWKS